MVAITTCNYLSNTNEKSNEIILDNAVNEQLIVCCMFEFSLFECSTLSHLFNTYCMNIYGSPLWK